MRRAAGSRGGTEREREMMTLVERSRSNAHVPARLSPLTVMTPISRARLKFHARDRGRLVVVAYQRSLVRPR